ncbi:MAG TPA: ATP-binding protein [Verrucomicrobiae bacterium]|nr:ATP-binding protein [Verrucomicrobiae bacterium]
MDFNRIAEHFEKQDAELKAFVASQPAAKACSRHPEMARALDLELTRYWTNYHRTFTAGYAPCPLCVEEREEMELRERLHGQGVPKNLLRATFENWKPHNKAEKANLAAVREFAETVRTGFLILTGDVGTGKTHLAVSSMRLFKHPFLIRQNLLLLRLRDTYRNRDARDPIADCKKAELLVLDELGLSGGGRDELPMLHEIIDYRHGEQQPTIITSNLTWGELKTALGERIADRLAESAFKVLTFGGASHRPERRKDYFPNHEQR